MESIVKQETVIQVVPRMCRCFTQGAPNIINFDHLPGEGATGDMTNQSIGETNVREPKSTGKMLQRGGRPLPPIDRRRRARC